MTAIPVISFPSFISNAQIDFLTVEQGTTAVSHIVRE